MSSCNDLPDVRLKSRLKRVLTKKAMGITTSGTTSFCRINKPGRWGSSVYIDAIPRLILALQRQIDLKGSTKLLFVSTFQEDAAQKEWIAGTTIESLKLKTFQRLKQITWETSLEDQDTLLSKKIELGLVRLLKIAGFYALAESNLTTLISNNRRTQQPNNAKQC